MQVRCPYCNTQQMSTDECMHCGADLKVVCEVYKKSAILYNKGYTLATQRELTKAIPYLEKAIYFNKYHIDAKNLLGLIYFELGDVGQALKLWILSTSIQKDDNRAAHYMEILQNNPRELESYKDSIVLYNRAFRYLQKKNDDMAVIRLKKAVHLNPHFVEARNLLALCYMYQKQESKALSQIYAVLRQDKSNEKALHYLGLIEVNQAPEEERKSIISTPHLNDLEQIKLKPHKAINRGAALTRYILYFVLGAVCMLGVEVGLIVPNEINTLENKMHDTLTENTNLKTQMDTFIKDAEDKQLALEEKNQKLVAENTALKEVQNKALQENKLWQAQTLSNDKNWVQSAEILNTIAVTDLKPENQSVYNDLKAKVYPKAGDELYSKGYDLYKKDNSVEAMMQFEKVMVYIPGTRNAGYSLYYMGQIEEKNNNVNKAIQYYQLIMEEYKNTSAYNKAKDRLKVLVPTQE